MAKSLTEIERLAALIGDELADSTRNRIVEAKALKRLKYAPPDEVFGALAQLAHNLQMSADRVLTLAHGYADRSLRGIKG
jgi:hypothetical protein